MRSSETALCLFPLSQRSQLGPGQTRSSGAYKPHLCCSSVRPFYLKFKESDASGNCVSESSGLQAK